MPAAGYRLGTGLIDAGSYGLYWSSTVDDLGINACYLLFDSGRHDWYYVNRSGGFTVRPVSE